MQFAVDYGSLRQSSQKGSSMKFAIPIECTVVMHVCANGATKEIAAFQAQEYWKDNYENPDEPCLVEGKYTKGSAKVLPSKAVDLAEGQTKTAPKVVHTIKGE